MSSPAILGMKRTQASIAAKKRTLQAQLATLDERLKSIKTERVAATHRVNRLRGLHDNAAAQLEEHRELLSVLPEDPRRDERIAGEAKDVEALRRELPYARALAAAATVAEEAAMIDVDWCKQDLLNVDRSPRAQHGEAEPVSGRAESLSVAAGYELIHTHRRWETGEWREMNRYHLTQSKTTRLLDLWLRADGARVLRDAAGILFIARPEAVIELRPTSLRVAPNEGDVLVAALAAYGLKAFEGSEDGPTFLVVPLDPSTPESEMYNGPRLLISSGEDADRPVREHDEPWVTALYDADGNHMDEVYAGEPGRSIAQDSASCARAIAEFAARDL
jgi:hypothetical protein